MAGGPPVPGGGGAPDIAVQESPLLLSKVCIGYKYKFSLCL